MSARRIVLNAAPLAVAVVGGGIGYSVLRIETSEWDAPVQLATCTFTESDEAEMPADFEVLRHAGHGGRHLLGPVGGPYLQANQGSRTPPPGGMSVSQSGPEAGDGTGTARVWDIYPDGRFEYRLHARLVTGPVVARGAGTCSPFELTDMNERAA